MKSSNLEGQEITEAELTYFQHKKSVCCQLQIKTGDNSDIKFKDYGDYIPAELSIIKDK